MTIVRNWTVIGGVAFCLSVVGCEGGKEEFKKASEVKKERANVVKKDDHDHDHGHHHHAPHHGSLTMIGDHQAQVELTVDADAGQLTAYILDGEAEKSLTVDQSDLEIVATPEGATEPLTLKLVPADAAKPDEGFVAKDEKLKGVKKLKGTLTSLKLKGKDKAEEKVAVEFDAQKAEAEAEEAHKDGHDEHAHDKEHKDDHKHDEKDHKHDEKEHKDEDHKAEKEAK